jgi:hypothetical protein
LLWERGLLGECDSVSRACRCQTGFTGKSCEVAAPVNVWYTVHRGGGSLFTPRAKHTAVYDKVSEIIYPTCHHVAFLFFLKHFLRAFGGRKIKYIKNI